MLVALCGSGDRAFKDDRSLFDLFMKLKVDYPEIQAYLHISHYDSLINTSHMCLTTLILSTSIRRLPDT
jgi:hypothetical protein